MQRNHKIDEKREELYSLKVTFVLNMTRVKLNIFVSSFMKFYWI